MITSIAQAADGPAPTLIIDLLDEHHADDDRQVTLGRIRAVRTSFMGADSPIGPKTIVILDKNTTAFTFEFYQGLSDGSIDESVSVCVNSATCALEALELTRGVITSGETKVRMGTEVFTFESEDPS